MTLVLDLATETTHLADESGEGVASTAAFAVVEIIGQVRGVCWTIMKFASLRPFLFHTSLASTFDEVVTQGGARANVHGVG